MTGNPSTVLPSELQRIVQELSPDQALWLSGYLAAVAMGGGLRSWEVNGDGAPEARPTVAAVEGEDRLTILYGTETGNARGVATDLLRATEAAGLPARAVDMAEYRTRELRDERFLALVAATHGEGDPPDGAMGFWEFLASRKAPGLDETSFAVLALGDSSYVEFCKAGRDLDERFEALGARRLLDRVDCDVDYDDDAARWVEQAVEAFGQAMAEARDQSAPAGRAQAEPAGRAQAEPAPPSSRILQVALAGLTTGAAGQGGAGFPGGGAAPFEDGVATAAPPPSRRNPVPVELLDRTPLTGLHSDKETLHLELDVEGSGLEFEPGDSLGILPRNEGRLVEETLALLGATGSEGVEVDGQEFSLAEALEHELELTLVTPGFLQGWAERAEAEELTALLDGGDREALQWFLRCRQVPDVIREFPVPGLDPEDFVRLLRRLQPRLYSIASSPRWTPGQLDLTVAVTRTTADGRQRNGVASSYLAERRRPGEVVEAFVDRNERFRLPEDLELPIILIGAGTGVAPFRAFLQDREELGARGPSWLFFGERRFREDFLYQTEWQRLLRDGVLTRMDVAFSRDQARKIYVQDRVRERGRELFAWLEEGARIYVCGDAKGMAPGVHQALLDVLVRESGLGREEAEAELRGLRTEGRYLRDVY